MIVTILDTKDPVTYTNKKGPSVMKQVMLADDTDFAKAIAYDNTKFLLLVKDEVVFIANFIKKADG